MSVLVSLDGLYERVEAHHVSEYRWNGWAVPSFTKEQVEKLLPATNAYALETVEASSFRFEGDRLIETRRLFDEPPVDEEGHYGTEEEEVHSWVHEDGSTLYGFGDSWVWELVDEVGLEPLGAEQATGPEPLDIRVPASGTGTVWTEWTAEDGTRTTLLAVVLDEQTVRLDLYGGLETTDSDPAWSRSIDVPAACWAALTGVRA
jgi:hypothetical protein